MEYNTLDAIVDFISERLDKGNDFAFKESVRFSVAHWRATLIKNSATRHKIEENLFQTICVKIIYDSTDICCEKLTGCKGVVSENIPETVDFYKVSPFYEVTDVHYKNFSHEEKSSWRFLDEKKYGNSNKIYDVINNRIYLKDNINLRNIYVKDIFFNPLEANECNDNDVKPCDPNYYPITRSMITAIIEGIISLDLKIINKDSQEINNEKTIR
jgi:hypothetical protein